MKKSLEGQSIFITGAGNGIGRAVALMVAARGATVGVNDLKPEFVDRVVSEITKAGGRAFGVVENISTRDGMQRAVKNFVDQTGALHGLVNNAAWVRYQAVTDIAPETVDRMLDIGFKAVIWGIQAIEPHMAHGGSIVNIASAAGFRSSQKSMVYSGIKAGVLGITRAAAADLGAKGIRVNAVSPSAVPTEGTARYGDAALEAKRISQTPLGRLGTAEEVASAVAFLLSDESVFISGESIGVNGGSLNTNL